MSFRVRFAPSPTGYLHVGGARTALFNWLLARRHGGCFILRIEDTDSERSSAAMVAGILEGLRWLQLDWDEGPEVGGPHAPYFQSGRLDRYRAMAARLVAAGHAYPCYCSPESLSGKRQAAEAAGGGWKYDRTCRQRSPDESAELASSGVPRAIRFLVPEGQTTFIDAVHGAIAFDNTHLEDFVILRSDQQPTYHLSVVADDIDMAITHVVRGDDHVSNTPKHVLLYQAWGAPLPVFAHVPLIMGPDKKRLSKRHGATSVTEYERMGYLPEAMINFLALLGWSPGDDRQLMTRRELTERFSLEGISGGNAVFDPEKLDWMNQQYVARLSVDELAARLRPILQQHGLWRQSYQGVDRDWYLRLVTLFQPRLKRLDNFPVEALPFLVDTVAVDAAAATKHLSSDALPTPFAALRAALARVAAFEPVTLETIVKETADRHGVKPALLIHALRVAVTGRASSPGIYDVLTLLGKERTLSRMATAPVG